MLSFGGQGSNQAIEDAGALGYLLNGVDNVHDIPERLGMFEQVRKKQASRVQIMSRVRVGKEKDVEQELLAYADPPGSGMTSLFDSILDSLLIGFTDVPTSFEARIAHDYGFILPEMRLG